MNIFVCIDIASQSGLRTNMWFLDSSNGICVKDCDTEESEACADMTDLTVTLYPSSQECCRQESWLNTLVCEAQIHNQRTNKWYTDMFEGRCFKDCDKADYVDASCGEKLPYDTVTLYDDATACCDDIEWIDRSLCLDKSNGCEDYWEQYFSSEPRRGYWPDVSTGSCTIASGVDVLIPFADSWRDKTKSECCFENFPAEPEYRTCMGDDYTQVPCSLPKALSGKWFVSYNSSPSGAPECLRECYGLGNECGGKAPYYQELYPSFEDCSAKHLWWLPSH